MARKTGRGRFIRTEISVDPGFNAVARDGNDFAALLFTLMIPHASDDATITGNPTALRLLVVPGFDKTDTDVRNALDAIEKHGLIEWWDRHEEVVYFKPRSFYACQHNIRHERRRPPVASSATPTPTVTPTLTANALGGSVLALFERGYGARLVEDERRELLPLLEGMQECVIEYAGQVTRTGEAVHLAPFVRSMMQQWRDAGVEELDDIKDFERKAFGPRNDENDKEVTW